MAKSKNSKTRDRRDTSVIAKRSLPAPLPSPNSPLRVTPADRTIPPPRPIAPHPVEDRRVFHPDGKNRPALNVQGRPAPVVVKDRPRAKSAPRFQKNRYGHVVASQTKAAVTFEAPDRTLVCIRRSRRKEVLFAKQKAGRGRMRKGKRSWLSKISCR